MDETTLRVELLLELKGGPQVTTQAAVASACSSDDKRTRLLAQAVAQQRGIQIVEAATRFAESDDADISE